jgi:MoxR-like ATPase
LPALRHRVAPAAEAEIEGLSVDNLLSSLLDRVPAPRV